MNKKSIINKILLVSLVLFCFCQRDATSFFKQKLQPLNSNIRQPVILIGGLMSSPQTWSGGEDGGFAAYLVQQGNFVYGGTLAFDAKKQLKHVQQGKGKVDFFMTGFYDSTRQIDSLTVELEQFIKYVLNYTNAPRVTLMAHSMGGVVARNYLVQNPTDHRVESLVTVASPHGGSYLANVLYGAGLLLGDEKEDLFKALEGASGLNWSSLAVSDLIDSGEESYLTKLNRKPHPRDVNYFSVVASARLLAILGQVVEKYFDQVIPGNTNGDWVVSLENQNMDNIEAFQTTAELKPRVLNSYRIDDANHFSVKHKYPVLKEILESFIERVK